MLEQQILPPNLEDLFAEFKNAVFASMNCIQIGKIETVNLEEQTVEIQIQVKRRISETETRSYPLLVDCPFIVLQGAGTYLEFPIKTGDYCLIFFNDRNIDTWWDSANVVEPLTKRKHSLSDGIALVGINPKTSVLDLQGNRVALDSTGYDLHFNTDKNTIFNNGVDNAVRYSSLETAFNELNDKYNSLVDILKTWTTAPNDGGAALKAAVVSLNPVSTANITPAKIEEIKLP